MLQIAAGLGLWASSITATVTNTPNLNGPIFPVVPSTLPGTKTKPREFVHPGLWHTHEDLERIRTNVEKGVDPWKSAYEKFSQDQYSQANYTMQGPLSVIERGAHSNYAPFTADVRAAWQNSLMCKSSLFLILLLQYMDNFQSKLIVLFWKGYITKDQAHWERATTILDAWGTNLTDATGTDASLLIGLEGDMFVNAAEIMRWEGGWVEATANWRGGSGFSIQLYWLFMRQSVINGQANYGLVSIKALLSFAVYLGDVTAYNYALWLMYHDLCAGIYGNYDSETAQPLEAGRDWGHVQGGLSWMSYAARTIQSQKSGDLYGFDDNLLLRAAEYTAKFNLNESVPYDPEIYRCEAVLVDGPWSVPSNESMGIIPGKTTPTWDILYYQYVKKRGINAPWVTKARETYGFEGGRSGVGSDDITGWGDLVWAY